MLCKMYIVWCNILLHMPKNIYLIKHVHKPNVEFVVTILVVSHGQSKSSPSFPLNNAYNDNMLIPVITLWAGCRHRD